MSSQGFQQALVPLPAAQQLTSLVAAQYLSSLEKAIPPTKASTPTPKRKKREPLWKASLPSLDTYSQMSILFERIFSKSSVVDSIAQAQTCRLNNYAWSDLRLFCGPPIAPHKNLVHRLDRTKSLTGRGVLALLLATPMAISEKLIARQQIVKALLADSSAVTALNQLYTRYLAIENRMISLWSDYDPLFNPFYEDFIQDVLYFGGRRAARLNTSASSLEIRKRVYFDFAMGLHATSLSFQGYYIWKVLTDQNTFKMITSSNNPLWVRVLAWYPLVTIPIELLSAKEHYQRWVTPLQYLATRLGDVQAWLKIAQEVIQTINSSPTLAALYAPYLENTRALLQTEPTTPLHQLIKDILHMPFKKWSVIFHNNGKLLQVYKSLLAHKDQLVDIFYELGQLDAFLSVARLLDESQTYPQGNTYTFAHFIPILSETKPSMHLVDMWNPLLDKKQAVSNTVAMGTTSGIRTIILTGPNAGGKSVFLSGVTLSLLLGQTFGIVPAREAYFTPFCWINTYLDISSDIISGKSLFAAEVDRAYQQLNIVRNLGPRSFAFTVMDEIFSGTNPMEGEAAAYSVVHYMAQYANNLSIVATHFPKLTLLPERAPGAGFANYKVSVTVTQDRKLNYSYKIGAGKSDQAIALLILENQGYDMAMLAEAKDILAQPQKYAAHF